MKIELDDTQREGPRHVRVSNGDQELYFNVNTYTKTTERTESVDTKSMFDEINAYWATLPEERREAIWKCYEEAYQVIQTQTDLNVITRQLQQIVARMYENIDLADIRNWVVFKSQIHIPSSLRESYTEQENQDRRDQTYLRSDYIELVCFAMAVRMMVPIWGEFISVGESVTGSVFKENVALGLLHRSHLVHSEAFKRLNTYAAAAVNSTKDKNYATAILQGLGTTELPGWVAALAIVRRLAIGELSSPDDNSHIITNIYQFIVSTLRSMDRKFGKPFGGSVSDKTEARASRNSTDEQSISVVEMYKVKQEVSDGEIVVLNVYTEQMEQMGLKVDETLPPELIALCYQHIQALQNEAVHRHQVTLVQWILHKVLPPRSGDSLNKPAILRAMAVTQALLWHWGFFDLAALVTATPLPIATSYGYGRNESRSRIPKDIMEELQRLYPHYQAGRGKAAQSVRQVNVGAKAIDAYADLVTPYDWRLNCPNELISKTNRIANSKKMVVPGDIRLHLARLIIRLNQDAAPQE